MPRILFEDRENYLFAMEAVDRRTCRVETGTAGRPRAAARSPSGWPNICPRSTRGTHRDSQIEQEFDDQTVFVELRVDPFYRHIARVHPDLAPRIEALIDEMGRTRVCLVHADFSPKNVLLVDTGPCKRSLARRGVANEFVCHREPQSAAPQVTLVDFETGHYGDPAFDLGFFLSHLVLKGVRAEGAADQYLRLAGIFWENYQAAVAPLGDDPAFSRRFPRAPHRRRILPAVRWRGSTARVRSIIFRTPSSERSSAVSAAASCSKEFGSWVRYILW